MRERREATRQRLFGGRRGGASVVFRTTRQRQTETDRRSRVSELLQQARGDIESLPQAQQIELARLQRREAPTRAGRAQAIRRGEQPLSRQRRLLEERRLNIQTEVSRTELLGTNLQSRQATLESQRQDLQSQADAGTLSESQAARFRTQIRNLERDIADFNRTQSQAESRVESFEQARQSFNREQQRLAVRGEQVSAVRTPTTIGALQIRERGAFGTPSPEVTGGRAFPVLRQAFDIRASFEEGAVEGREVPRFLQRRFGIETPSFVGDITGGIFGAANVPIGLIFKPIGAAVQQAIPAETRFAPLPITREAGLGLTALKEVPIVRGFLPFTVSEELRTRRALISFDRAGAAEALTLGASFLVPAAARAARARTVPKALRAPVGEFAGVDVRPSTRAVVLEAITIRPPTQFPLSFRPKGTLKVPPSGLGPGFPLTFKIREPSFAGLTRVKPRRVKAPTLDSGVFKEVALDPRITRLARIVREEQSGVSRAVRKPPKIQRFKPLRFEGPFRERRPTIQKLKPVKRARRKPITTDLEISTERFEPVTQRFRRRGITLFEEIEQRPLERFVPEQIRFQSGFEVARLARASQIPREAALTRTGLRTTAAQRQIQLPAQRQIQLQSQRLTDIQRTRGLERQTFRQISTTRSKAAQAQRLAFRSAFAVPLIQEQVTRQRRLVRTVQRLRQPRGRIRGARRRPLLFDLGRQPFSFEEPEKRAKVEGFHSKVKARPFRKQRFKRVTLRPRPKANALQRGLLVADQTTAQSVRLEKTKKLVDAEPAPLSSLGFKFRKKGNTFIERRAHAIDTPTEVQGLTAAKFLAQEKRGLFGAPTRRRRKRRRS